MATSSKGKRKTPRKSQRSKSLADLARIATRNVPRAEFDKLPTDGARNHDFYLYGAPKKLK